MELYWMDIIEFTFFASGAWTLTLFLGTSS
jgi:hypothetical protein